MEVESPKFPKKMAGIFDFEILGLTFLLSRIRIENLVKRREIKLTRKITKLPISVKNSQSEKCDAILWGRA